MRPSQKADGTEVYEYMLLYTDDALAIVPSGEKMLREVGKSSVGPPDIYLGGKMRAVELENGSRAWSFGSSQYVQAAVKNVESYLHKIGESFPTKVDTNTHDISPRTRRYP